MIFTFEYENGSIHCFICIENYVYHNKDNILLLFDNIYDITYSVNLDKVKRWTYEQ